MLGAITTIRGMSMRRGLTIVLAAQAVIAGLLVLSDIDARWLPQWRDVDALPTGPVAPGDQVRRYDPTRVRPDYTAPATGPNIEMPDNLPERLEFSVRDVGDFGEYLLVNGAIAPGDAQRFEAYLATLGEIEVPVALNSPGGTVEEALRIGRILREQEANTAILPGMACVSACPYILAGGIARVVSRQGAVGLHQHYYDTPGLLPAFLAVEEIQKGQGRTMAYLIEMGVEPGVMLHSLNTPPDDIYVLVEEELLESRVATEVTD